MTIEIRNAIIKSTTLTTADHGCLSSFLTLDYGGTCQGFGGYTLYSPEYQSVNTGIWIWEILKITDNTEWSNVPGSSVRVKREGKLAIAIGHFLEDLWFTPEEHFK